MTQSDNEIGQIVERYRAAFLAIDARALTSLWDTTHAPLVYVAMEKDQPIRGWPAIRTYYEALPQALERMIDMRITKLEIDEHDDMALAYFEFVARAQLRQGAFIAPEGRVSMALHRTANGWRIFHYHESALAASAAQGGAANTANPLCL